ncbi:DNA double-strand break repair protein Mre11 [Halobaculum sp. MBLA0147]|uniref:DNA double-strand break repair protein Mre11 n=1 Tax=Halobaculum sp. MBLA0147 TaxID=3079934 RepID=UPI0035235E05
MTRVVHTGDTHVGYRQYHSPERREDFREAFERVVTDAVEAEVDAVVHAGDLFHDRRPELPDLLGVLSALRELDAAGVPFLAVVGNHESTRGGQWLDLFESLGLATRLGDEPIVVGDTAFYGLDHVPESRRDDLTYEFAPHDADSAALVAHGLFTPFAHGEWDTETVLEEATVDFDAVLLGDNHEPDQAQVRDTWVTYCGSTERASATERDPRGYNLVTFDETVDVRRRTLETREFVFVEAELGAGEGTERVRDRLREYDLTDAVVIVEITGEGEPVTPAEVESFAVDEGALIARVRDRREVESTAEVSVEFADPDEAVRERLSEMGLSEPAREVDDLVRDDGVTDSNVRERVTRRVRERLDADGDENLLDAVDRTASFESGDETDEPGGETGEDDGASGEETDTDERDDSEESDTGGADTDDTDETSDTTADDTSETSTDDTTDSDDDTDDTQQITMEDLT